MNHLLGDVSWIMDDPWPDCLIKKGGQKDSAARRPLDFALNF